MSRKQSSIKGPENIGVAGRDHMRHGQGGMDDNGVVEVPDLLRVKIMGLVSWSLRR